MVWNPVWEKIFQKRDWGKYPPEELIRFIANNYYQVNNRKKIRVLEIGCGTGANLWYLAREGFTVSGIDGSTTAIIKLKQRFRNEKLKGEFIVGDISKLPWPENTFDCVIDVGCLACNCEKDTQNIINKIFRVLKSNGKHFSLTPKKGSWGDETGIHIDNTSFKNIKTGPFKDIGIVRFASLSSLKKLYSGFKNLQVEYSLRTVNNGVNKITHCVLSCDKR